MLISCMPQWSCTPAFFGSETDSFVKIFFFYTLTHSVREHDNGEIVYLMKEERV